MSLIEAVLRGWRDADLVTLSALLWFAVFCGVVIGVSVLRVVLYRLWPPERTR